MPASHTIRDWDPHYRKLVNQVHPQPQVVQNLDLLIEEIASRGPETTERAIDEIEQGVDTITLTEKRRRCINVSNVKVVANAETAGPINACGLVNSWSYHAVRKFAAKERDFLGRILGVGPLVAIAVTIRGNNGNKTCAGKKKISNEMHFHLDCS